MAKLMTQDAAKVLPAVPADNAVEWCEHVAVNRFSVGTGFRCVPAAETAWQIQFAVGVPEKLQTPDP